MKLSASMRDKAAEALRQVLDDVYSGAVTATPGEAAYIAGAIAGLRADGATSKP